MDSYFKIAIQNEGKEYYEQNRVFTIQQHDSIYTAIVLGSQPYDTSITLDDNNQIIMANCNCQQGQLGKHCKHEAALYLAIKDRLPVGKAYYFDSKKRFQELKKQNGMDYIVNTRFCKELEEYLDKIKQFHKKGELDITGYQKVLEEIISLRYFYYYEGYMLNQAYQPYVTFISEGKYHEETATWLKRIYVLNKFDKVRGWLNTILDLLEIDLQIDVLKTVLKKKQNDQLFRQFLIKLHQQQVEPYDCIQDLLSYQTNEYYIIEMMKYYLKQSKIKAKDYYIKNQNYLKSNQSKAKAKSLLGNNPDSFYDYLTDHMGYDEYNKVYQELNCFYDDFEDHYLTKYLDELQDAYSIYTVIEVLGNNHNYKYLAYYLLDNPIFDLYIQYQDELNQYSQEIDRLIHVECLKHYFDYSQSYENIEEDIPTFFLKLTMKSRLEIAEVIKKANPRRKKLSCLLDACLDMGGNHEV